MYTGTASWAALRINEWLAGNDSHLDPADNDTDDWLEIYNPTGTPVVLTNWRLSDNPALPAKFVIPAGYRIPAGGRLLVWADNEPEQNGITQGQLHVPFRLSAGGETLRLTSPDGLAVDSVAFSAQSPDLSEGRYPDGGSASGPLTLPSPGAANVLTVCTGTVRDGAAFNVTVTATPGRRYVLQFSPDLVTWTSAAPVTATDASLTLSGPAAAGDAKRFYRVVTMP